MDSVPSARSARPCLMISAPGSESSIMNLLYLKLAISNCPFRYWRTILTALVKFEAQNREDLIRVNIAFP